MLTRNVTQGSRARRIDAFLETRAWLIAEGRDQTRAALIELLYEITDSEFAHVEGGRVLLQANAHGSNVTSYALNLGDVPARPGLQLRFQMVSVEVTAERLPFLKLKAMLGASLACAFAKIDRMEDRRLKHNGNVRSFVSAERLQ